MPRVDIDFEGQNRGALAAARGTAQAVNEVGDEVEKTARRAVAAESKQRQGSEALVREYKRLADQAKAGSREQVAALSLVEREQRKLAGTTRASAVQTAEAERNIGRMTRGAIAGSGALHGMGRMIAFASSGFLGAAGFVYALKTSVGAASNLNEQINKTMVVFGQAGRELVTWSKTTSTALGIASDQALEFAGVFGNMLVPMGFARQEAAGMSKELVELAADMASFNNASPQETLEALRSGLAGETEPLRRFGIFLSQARIEAEALSSGLVKHVRSLDSVRTAQSRVSIATAQLHHQQQVYGAGTTQVAQAQVALDGAERGLEKALQGKTTALTASQKATAIYRIILKDTADAQGDFGRTSGGLANQQRILTAQIRELEIGIGRALIPTVLNATKGINAWLSSSENQAAVTRAVKGAVDELVPVLKTLFALVVDGKQVFGLLAGAVGGVGNAIRLLIALRVATWFATMRREALLTQATLLGAGKAPGRVSMFATGWGGWVGALLTAATAAYLFRDQLLGIVDAAVKAAASPMPGQGPEFTQSRSPTSGRQIPIIRAGTSPGIGPNNAAYVRNTVRELYVSGWPAPRIYDAMVAAGYAPGVVGRAVADILNDSSAAAARERHKVTQQAEKTSAAVSSGRGEIPTTATPTQQRQLGAVLAYARKYGPGSGITYTWGGVSPEKGFDCSGYLMAAYRSAGITIPHNTVAQFNDPNAMDSTGQERPGDGVYFHSSGPGPPPQHCGIYIGGGKFIEYFSGGKPARISYLGDRGSAYMGARRWIKIVSDSATASPPAASGGGAPAPKTSPLRVGATPKARTDVTVVPPSIREAIARAGDRPGAQIAAYETLLHEYLKRRAGKGLTADERADLTEAIADIRSKIRDANERIREAAAAENAKILAAAQAHPEQWVSLGATRGGAEIPGLTRAVNAYLVRQRRAIDAALRAGRQALGQGSSVLSTLLGFDQQTQIKTQDQFGRVITTTISQVVTHVNALLHRLEAAMASGNTRAVQRAVAAWRAYAPAVSAAVEAGTAAAAAAAERAQAAFETAFSRVSSRVMAAFDRETQDALAAMQRAESDREDALRQQYERRGDALAAAADARIKRLQATLERSLQRLERRRAALTPAEQALRDLQAGHEAEAVERDRASAQTDLQAALLSGDEQAVRAARERIAGLDYQAQVAALQQQAEAERQALDASVQRQEDQLRAKEQAQEESIQRQLDEQRKGLDAELQARLRTLQDEEAAREREYQDERDAQRDSLEVELDQWRTALEDKSKTWADFVGWLTGKVKSGIFGANLADPVAGMAAAGDAQGSAFARSFLSWLSRAAAAWNEFVQAVASGAPASMPSLPEPPRHESHGLGSGGIAAIQRGGRVPGRWIGRQDTVMLRGTPGEEMLDRDLSIALRRIFVEGRGGAPSGPTYVFNNPAYFGGTERQVFAALGQSVEPYQGRRPSYRTIL